MITCILRSIFRFWRTINRFVPKMLTRLYCTEHKQEMSIHTETDISGYKLTSNESSYKILITNFSDVVIPKI